MLSVEDFPPLSSGLPSRPCILFSYMSHRLDVALSNLEDLAVDACYS